MTSSQTTPPPDSNAVRQQLVETLQLDLIGPRPQDLALERERLPQTPSRWYLTGFLAPTDAPEEQRAQDSEEELDEGSEPFHGSDDSSTPERASSKRLLFPSSIGLSILVDEETTELTVDIAWGDYEPELTEDEAGTAADGEEGPEAKNGSSKRRFSALGTRATGQVGTNRPAPRRRRRGPGYR